MKEKTFKEYSDAIFDAILQPPKPITDQELEKEIKWMTDLEISKKREWVDVANALAELVAEKQRRWAKTLSQEEINNL